MKIREIASNLYKTLNSGTRVSSKSGEKIVNEAPSMSSEAAKTMRNQTLTKIKVFTKTEILDQLKQNVLNFREIKPGKLYSGGEPFDLKSLEQQSLLDPNTPKREISDIKLLNQLGVKHFIDLTGHNGSHYAKEAKSLGISIHSFNLDKFREITNIFCLAQIENPLLKEYLIKFKGLIDFINESKDSIYVHCSLGETRTGSFIELLRMLTDGLSYEEALHDAQIFYGDQAVKYIKPFLNDLINASKINLA